jgi:hypothetical protein
MSDEVWWASRDDDTNMVEFRDRKPVKVSLIDSGGYWMGAGCGVFLSMTLNDFEKISSVNLAAGECIPIRPLRIERVEVKDDR